MRTPIGGSGADLELSINIDDQLFNIYEFKTIMLTVQNTGNLNATNIRVKFDLPDGFVYSASDDDTNANIPAPIGSICNEGDNYCQPIW